MNTAECLSVHHPARDPCFCPSAPTGAHVPFVRACPVGSHFPPRNLKGRPRVRLTPTSVPKRWVLEMTSGRRLYDTRMHEHTRTRTPQKTSPWDCGWGLLHTAPRDAVRAPGDAGSAPGLMTVRAAPCVILFGGPLPPIPAGRLHVLLSLVFLTPRLGLHFLLDN